MTTTQHRQQSSLDHESLTMVPVILGGPSPRRAGERRWPRLRRQLEARDTAGSSRARSRLSLPR